MGAGCQVIILESFALVWIDLAIFQKMGVAWRSSCCSAEPLVRIGTVFGSSSREL